MSSSGTTQQKASGQKKPRQPTKSNWVLFKRPWHEVFIHVSLSLGALVLFRSFVGDVSEVYQKQRSSYPVGDIIGKSYIPAQCSDSYSNIAIRYYAHLPASCGLYITDRIGVEDKIKNLIGSARRIFDLGSATMKEESSVLDFHSGILSRAAKFVNIYQYMKKKQKRLLTEVDIENYNIVVNALLDRVAGEYQVPKGKLHLTRPSFFSKLSNVATEAKNEYWHSYVNKSANNTVHFTAVLYLSTYGRDFGGGRLMVTDDKNRSQFVEPKFGRVIFHNFGCEATLHRLASGTRYAFIASFTLEESAALSRPMLEVLPVESLSSEDSSNHY